MFVNSDFSDLLRIFNEHNVKYMVVGGYAVVQYAEPRYTKDLDVLIATNEENSKAVYSALREFGAPLFGLTSKDFAEDGFFFQMGVPPIRVDVIMGVPGVNFEECWSRRVEVDFEGLKVIFISKQDLIISKRAAGHPQDLIDADLLSED
jgi:hypothetical protein